MKPKRQKLFSLRKPWELFGSRGDPRLRLAKVLQARGAFAEAEPLRRRVLEAEERRLGPEHIETLTLVNNLAFVLQLLGKFSEAPLMCCAAVTVAGGWCSILWWEKLGKNAGKQRPSTTAFSDHLRICHLCRSAMMHEQWTCQFYANHLKSSQITSCMDMPKHGHVKV